MHTHDHLAPTVHKPALQVIRSNHHSFHAVTVIPLHSSSCLHTMALVSDPGKPSLFMPSFKSIKCEQQCIERGLYSLGGPLSMPALHILIYAPYILQ